MGRYVTARHKSITLCLKTHPHYLSLRELYDFMVIPNEPSDISEDRFVLVVPTINRPILLRELLQSVNSGLVLPKAIFILDASDSFVDAARDFPKLNIQHVHSEIKSAAAQRNRGIELSLSIVQDFEFIAFLDDDILIDSRYFANVSQRFKENPDFVGISGIALNSETKQRQRSIITDAFGLTGKAGSITKALVNISPEGISNFEEVGWLIGCSVWRRQVIEQIRFEDDFSGQSIFEDVIFSYRARLLGRLGVDPNITIKHALSEVGRPNSKRHAYFWVCNRYRLFRYSKKEFSQSRFWILNLILFGASAIRGIVQPHQRGRAIGLFCGTVEVLREKILV